MEDWEYVISGHKWSHNSQAVRDKLHAKWYFGKPNRRNEAIANVLETAIDRFQFDKAKSGKTWLVIGAWKNSCQVGCMHCHMKEDFYLEEMDCLVTDERVMNQKSDEFCRWLFPFLGLDFEKQRARW